MRAPPGQTPARLGGSLIAPFVAYFSMEIALESGIPTYAGGLGVLAGDTIRSAADLGLSLVAVSLVHRHGYFHQKLDASGAQTEQDASWKVEELLEPLAPRVAVEIEGRSVTLRAWRHRVRGICGDEVPVYLLDADLPENTAEDRDAHRSPVRRRRPLPALPGERCSGSAACACCARSATRGWTAST